MYNAVVKQRYAQVKETEHRIRASMQYTRWIERNRGTSCVRCGRQDNLNVHHIVDLYHIILGLWKFYGDWDAVLKHSLAMHEDNKCEGVTICEKCHEAIHPGRTVSISEADIHIANWTVLPRLLDLKFSLGSKGREKGSVGLLGFQTVFGLGWLLMNGYCEHGVAKFNWRRFSETLGKKPSVSFSNGLELALESLVEAKVLDAFSRNDNEIKTRIDKGYLEMLRQNPWFAPMEDARTSRMTVLVLRWFLGQQGHRSSYLIGKDRLASHMQLGTRTPAFVMKCVEEAAQEISWVKMEESGENFRFQITNRGMIPIHSLRSHLAHALSQ